MYILFLAITDILVSQPQGKILVGDPHQQIYSFRGAVNAMENVHADTIFYLTQSFRFGPEISHIAASCLEVLKKEKKKTLVGSGRKGNELHLDCIIEHMSSSMSHTIFDLTTPHILVGTQPNNFLIFKL